MTADSYLEMVLVFMGWLINNSLWMIITFCYSAGV